MAPFDIVTILVAYTAVVLTIVGGILSFMLYHFIPLKSKVGKMWHDLYGADGSGHIEEADAERDSMRDMLESARTQHRRQGARIQRVLRYLGDLSEHLAGDEHHDDPPHLYDDNYVDRRDLREVDEDNNPPPYRGGD